MLKYEFKVENWGPMTSLRTSGREVRGLEEMKSKRYSNLPYVPKKKTDEVKKYMCKK